MDVLMEHTWLHLAGEFQFISMNQWILMNLNQADQVFNWRSGCRGHMSVDCVHSVNFTADWQWQRNVIVDRRRYENDTVRVTRTTAVDVFSLSDWLIWTTSRLWPIKRRESGNGSVQCDWSGLQTTQFVTERSNKRSAYSRSFCRATSVNSTWIA